MSGSHEYYASTCKMCGDDCDGSFCSHACQRDYEDGLADYLYEQERDRRLFEESETLKELCND